MSEERDFLLRSIDDLEREHDAGDLEDDDFAVLRDDYVARAAEAIRAGADGADGTSSAAALAEPPRRRARGRTAAVGVAILAAAIGAGVLVARGSGERLPGQTITGDIPELARSPVLPSGCPAALVKPAAPQPKAANPRQPEIDQLLLQGQASLGTDLLAAIKEFDAAVAIDPDQVIGLTYGGWIRRLVVTQGGPAELLDRAQTLLNRAIAADPTYPDARAFRGVLLLRDRNQPKAALVDLCTLALLNPPAEVQQLAAGALADAAAAAAK